MNLVLMGFNMPLHHEKNEQFLITKHFQGKCKHTQQSQLLFQELFSPLKLKNIYYFLT